MTSLLQKYSLAFAFSSLAIHTCLLCSEAPLPQSTDTSLTSEHAITPALVSKNLSYGRICGTKVRLRLQPDLDSPILRQLHADTPVLIGQEVNGFIEVLPSKEDKAYIFRTFILDGRIEGKRVNVRIAPDLKAPVVAQLNHGDRVEGQVSSQSRKWFEINMPESVRFYVWREYIEQISQEDFQSLFAHKTQNSSHITKEENMELNEEPPEESCEENFLANESLLNKNLDENKSSQPPQEEISEDFVIAKNSSKRQSQQAVANDTPSKTQSSYTNEKWGQIEETYIKQWLTAHPHLKASDYYTLERMSANVLHGHLERYREDIKDAPGDFVLVLNKNHRAFIYSPSINLDDFVGQNITILASKRDPGDFAWPAYVVLELQDARDSKECD